MWPYSRDGGENAPLLQHDDPVDVRGSLLPADDAATDDDSLATCV